MDPIAFTPIYMERVWGGRELESVYGRALPPGETPIGEAWEIVDREDHQSVVDGGPLSGTTLNQLWRDSRKELFGPHAPDSPRFPILIKILDARDDLSIQVHPPAHIASELGGEPKTEMWYIADRTPGAKLYVGLKHGIARDTFEQAVMNGTVADCVHVIQPNPRESIFIPSGRLHAIGGGFLIHEIQQNSDTTFRVFDWNRTGLDGRPRALHVAESLASIDFTDHEPAMDTPRGAILAECPYFVTTRIDFQTGDLLRNISTDRFSILSIVDGELASRGGRRFRKGSSFLLPCGADPVEASGSGTVLQITLP